MYNDVNDYNNNRPEYIKDGRPGTGTAIGPGVSNGYYYNSTIDGIGGLDSACQSDTTTWMTPGGYPNPGGYRCTGIILNHRGYLFAASTGTYVFNFTRIDEVIYMWYGSNALQGWTQDNANGAFFISSPGTQGAVSVSAFAGQYVPIRIYWGNTGGPGAFAITITRPDGTVIISSAGVGRGSGLLVRNSCDSTAPPFPYQFGAEV